MNDRPNFKPVKFHPLAEVFPLIEGDEFAELVASIRETGLNQPIVMHEGMILDGRNRYRACIEAEVAPRFEEFSGDDPARFVLAQNVNRRHLNASQRALITAQLVTLKQGQRADLARKKDHVENSTSSLTRDEAAAIASVHFTTVHDAKTVLSAGTREEIQAIKDGKASVNTIAREIRAKKSPEARKARRDTPLAKRGGTPKRIRRQQLDAAVWGHLKDGLIHLSGLPLPADVAAIVASSPARRKTVNELLPASLKWLTEFAQCLAPR